MVKYIIFKNGELIDKTNHNDNILWDGDFSKANFDGNIVNFVTNYLNNLNQTT